MPLSCFRYPIRIVHPRHLRIYTLRHVTWRIIAATVLVHRLHVLFAHMRCGADRYGSPSRLFWPSPLVCRPLDALCRCDTLCHLCACQRVREVLTPSDPGVGFGTALLRGGSFWMACPHAPRQVGRRYEPVAEGGHSTTTASTHMPFPGEGLSSERVPCISMCLRTAISQSVDLKRGTGRQPQTPNGRRPCRRSEMP